MNQYKTVAFHTLGCKLNFSETSTIARNLIDAGYGRVDFSRSADVYVINTCSVTNNADKECRQIVRRVKRQNPDSHVIVIGCYAQLKPQEIAAIDGVTLVLGANEKFNVAEHLERLDSEPVKNEYVAGRIGAVREFKSSYSMGDRTRTFLKVQDGCDYFCSFCTIPLARGKSRSESIESTIQVAKEVAAQGTQEVVLTGVNTGDFGAGTDETFYDLVQALDEKVDVPRFRISSIEPNLLSNEIIEFSARSDKFVPHFHIPLQSGSDKLLESMKRKYKSALYKDRVETILRLMPDAAIGVDVIVGYPGEDDEAFEETYAFLQSLPVAYFHVFTYSERPNTVAVKMDGVVPKQVRNERNKRLRILSEKKKRAFYESQLGTKRKVLWEEEQHGEMMQGYTENYLRVKAPYDKHKVNTFELVEVASVDRDGVCLAHSIKEIATA